MVRYSMLVLFLVIGTAAIPAHLNTKKVADADVDGGRFEISASGAPSTVAPSIFNCQCNTYQVWNDVIFIVDTSDSTTSSGVQNIWGTMLKMLAWNNVQTTNYTETNYYMRVGIITYASEAKVFANLGQYDYSGLLNFATLPFSSGDYGTNLEQAIQLANDQFNSAAHRSNSKKVIVVMASTYNEGNYPNPQDASEAFKQDGGILMVFDYIQVHGAEDPFFQEIASPGYFFDSLDTYAIDHLLSAQCDANCFCNLNQVMFETSSRNYPLDGCYASFTTPSTGPLSKSRCLQQNGVRAFDKSESKNTFLAGLFSEPSNFYIGLQYSNGQWVWDDGTYLGSYHPWYSGVTPPGTDGKQCVYVTASTNQWVATACQNSFDGVCQFSPCDSTNYCR